MRAVIQRVSEAWVDVDGACVGRIGHGLVVLVGIALLDGPPQADWLVDKLLGMRLFATGTGAFDASVVDSAGAVLLVSQFTLHADTRKGRRPSFSNAAPAERAQPLYDRVVAGVAARGVTVASGRFGADMAVHLVNDGPVTILLDSEAA
jgi:D-aminoacyl-tRNA deacylase